RRDSSACTAVPVAYTTTHSTAARAARCGRGFIGKFPFGSLAAFGPRGSEVHSFPPPPRDGFSIVGELPTSPASSRNNPSTDFSGKRVCLEFSGKRVAQRTPVLTVPPPLAKRHRSREENCWSTPGGREFHVALPHHRRHRLRRRPHRRGVRIARLTRQ